MCKNRSDYFIIVIIARNRFIYAHKLYINYKLMVSNNRLSILLGFSIDMILIKHRVYTQFVGIKNSTTKLIMLKFYI